MKRNIPLLLVAAAVSNLPLRGHGASLTVEPASPTADLLLSRGDGSPLGTAGIQQAFGFRNADPANTEGTRGRGQSFVINSIPGATYDISNLSVALGNSGDDAGYRPDGILTLTVFTWDGDDADDFTAWDTGTGAMTEGTVQLFSGSFAIPTGMVLPASDFLSVSFEPGELSLSDGATCGFFFRYELEGITDEGGLPLDEDVTIAFDSDNNAPDNAPGALLNTNPTTEGFQLAPNLHSGSRDLNYFITGTVGVSDFVITEISRSGDMLSLTWDSTEGATYAIKYSTDLITWDSDLDDGVAADEGTQTTRSFDLGDFGLADLTDLWFRIER